MITFEPRNMAETRHQTALPQPFKRTPALARFTSYLKRRRTHAILASFLVVSVLLVVFSGIDIRISRLFFDHGFYLADQGWVRWMQYSVHGFIVVSMASVVLMWLVNRLRARNLFAIDGRKIAYLFLVLILGAGLIVNVAFKDNFGRARPRDIAEFGGSEQFTPAFMITDACDANCSFASGDSAGAFFALAFFMVARRKRAVAVAAVGFGVLVSASRIASGAHFFSDTVVSFFVMLIVADCLHYFMFQQEREAKPIADTSAPDPDIRNGAAGESLP